MDDHAVVIADRSGTIELWSRGAEKLFGYSSQEAVGQSLDLIVPEEFREQHWNGFRQAMGSAFAKMEGQSFDLPISCRDGGAVAPGTFVLLRDGKKNVIGAMAIFNLVQSPAPG